MPFGNEISYNFVQIKAQSQSSENMQQFREYE